MEKKSHSGKLRSVIAKIASKNISQEPEMMELPPALCVQPSPASSLPGGMTIPPITVKRNELERRTEKTKDGRGLLPVVLFLLLPLPVQHY
jgi:hypothetical protein